MSVLVCSAYLLHIAYEITYVQQESEIEYTFHVLEDEKTSSFGSSRLAKTTLRNGDEASVILYVPQDTEKVQYGKTLTAYTKIRMPSKGLSDQQKLRGIVGVVYLNEFSLTNEQNILLSFVTQLREYATEIFGVNDSDPNLLLKAVLTGDKSGLYDSELYQEVKTCGLAHLVAVSGAHLVVISSFVSILMNRLPVNRWVKLFIQSGVLLLYLIFVGFPVSCLRATVMAILSLIAPYFMRRSSALSSLGIIIILFVGFDPGITQSLSFSLSVLATLGIVLFMPLLLSCITRKGMIAECFTMTLAATFLTLPLSAGTFSQFSLIAPLSNLVATPFLTLLCVGGVMTLVASAIPVLGGICIMLITMVAEVFCKCVELLAKIPFASIPVSVDLYSATAIVIVLSALLWVFWTKITLKKLVLSFVIASIAFVTPYAFGTNATEIVMLDVGQGDSFLIRSGGKTILVDTGNNPSKLLKGVAQNKVTTLDAVFISHPDDDHCGCVEELSRVVSINRVYLARGMLQSKEENPLELTCKLQNCGLASKTAEVSVGDVLSFGNVRIDMLAPREITDGGNEDSICMLVSFFSNNVKGRTTALFTGDAEKEVIENLIQQYTLRDVDIVKVAHHGSRNSLTEELIEDLHPNIALVSVGERNSYGHPNQEVISCLEKEGAAIYRTDKNGMVTCTINQDNVEVSFEK